MKELRAYVKSAINNEFFHLSNVQDAWTVNNGVRALVTVHVKHPVTIVHEADGEEWTETLKMGKHKALFFIREPYIPHPTKGGEYPSLVDVEFVYT